MGKINLSPFFPDRSRASRTSTSESDRQTAGFAEEAGWVPAGFQGSTVSRTTHCVGADTLAGAP